MAPEDRGPRPQDLTARARRGGGVLFARQGVQAAVQFAASVALARLLAPEEFGVAALAAAFSAFPQLFGDLGLGTYLIQAREADGDLFRRLFSIGLVLSVVLAALQCALAFTAAAYYGDQRVTGVLLVSSLGHPGHALWSLHEKWLRRALRFRAAAVLSVVFNLLAVGGCVAMAAMGFSYWSLVWPPVLAHFAIAPAYWVVSRQAPLPRFGFAPGERPRDLVSFSAFSTGNSLLGYVANNADYLLIGRMLDAEALGFYTFAYTKAFTFSKKVLATAGELALPVYAAAAQERERLERGFYKGLSLMLLVNVPLAGLLAALAPVLIPLVFGERWLPSVLPFQILCVHAAVNALTSPIDSVSYAIGRPDINFKIVSGMVAVLVAAYAVGAKAGGIVGVAVAVAAVKSAASIAKSLWVFRALGWNWFRFASLGGVSLAISLAAACAAGTVTFRIVDLPPVPALLFGGTAFLFVYLVGMAMMQRDVLRGAWKLAVGDHEG
ncbi:MAG: oligosaccharide flippase family protein [Acidobacteriota bacterium]